MALGLGLVLVGAALVVVAPAPWSFLGFVLAAAGVVPAVEGAEW